MSSPNHGTNAHSHQATAGSQSGDGFDPHPPAPLLAHPQASAQHGQAPATGDHRNQAGYHWVGNHWKYTSPSDVERYRQQQRSGPAHQHVPVIPQMNRPPSLAPKTEQQQSLPSQAQVSWKSVADTGIQILYGHNAESNQFEASIAPPCNGTASHARGDTANKAVSEAITSYSRAAAYHKCQACRYVQGNWEHEKKQIRQAFKDNYPGVDFKFFRSSLP